MERASQQNGEAGAGLAPDNPPAVSKGLPLHGTRVLDFSRLLPGPWCTQFLSDLGATVIKVEMPGTGDMSRANPPAYKTMSVYFNSVNGGKRSIAIDLTRPGGNDIIERLIKGSDVIVESFRPGVAKKLGVDYEAAKSLNGRIIYCAISGFGQTGPLSHISGHDLVIQAMSGFVALGAEPGVRPQVPGFQAADYAGGAIALVGILSGLMKCKATGEGSYLDVAMFDSLFAMCNITQTAAMARKAGQSGEPALEVWGGNPRYATYLTKDGRSVAVALLEARLWANFCNVIGRPDLVDADEDPSARHTDHGEKSDQYKAAIADYCLSMPRDDLIAEMERNGVPICAVYSPDETLASENVAARKLIHVIDDPAEGPMPQIVNPLAGSGLVREQRTSAPNIGFSNDEILHELGFETSDIESFRTQGVIAP